jgi:hypothetical protein
LDNNTVQLQQHQQRQQKHNVSTNQPTVVQLPHQQQKQQFIPHSTRAASITSQEENMLQNKLTLALTHGHNDHIIPPMCNNESLVIVTSAMTPPTLLTDNSVNAVDVNAAKNIDVVVDIDNTVLDTPSQLIDMVFEVTKENGDSTDASTAAVITTTGISNSNSVVVDMNVQPNTIKGGSSSDNDKYIGAISAGMVQQEKLNSKYDDEFHTLMHERVLEDKHQIDNNRLLQEQRCLLEQCCSPKQTDAVKSKDITVKRHKRKVNMLPA